MRDVMTAAGVLLVLGTVAWYVGSLLLRLAAFGWFVFAGVGLLLAGQGDQSPWARRPSPAWASAAGPPGTSCTERAAMVGHPDGRARVRRTPAAPIPRRTGAPKRGLAPACPATPDARCRPAAGPARAAPRDELPVFARPRALLLDY